MALSSLSTDAQVLAQYEDNACYWQSLAKAEAFEEAIVIILNRFARMNTIGGKSWTREDLTKLLTTVTEKRESLTTSSSVGGRTHFTRGRAL